MELGAELGGEVEVLSLPLEPFIVAWLSNCLKISLLYSLLNGGWISRLLYCYSDITSFFNNNNNKNEDLHACILGSCFNYFLCLCWTE